jgi:NADPH-dependent ferric siderophore reductase
MADVLPESARAALDDPFAQLTGPLASTTRLDFEVVDSARLTPHMQRLRLTAPQLDGFGYRPGQDVMLLVAAEGNRPVRRRYTIRRLDPAARLLTLDIVLHGDGPGERWVRSARSGDRIEGIGPRGKITTSPAADWHLFIGDESALPAIFAMTEALPPGRPATLVLEIPQESDEQDLAAVASTRISWLHRLGAPAGDPSALAAGAAEVELPTGRGHAYLFGEATWCPGCGRSWPGGGSARTRCHLRPTGAAAGPTPATASPPGTPSQRRRRPRRPSDRSSP